MAGARNHPPRATMPTTEALAERKERALIVRQAANIAGTNVALARAIGMKGASRISYFVTGERPVPQHLLDACMKLIQEHGE